MAKVTIKNLKKEYNKDTIAVNNLSMDIQDKELMVLVGPSGCGKTTTLNCIAGLDHVTSGHIFFNEEDVTEVPPHQRNIAMVFQSSLLYPHLTSRQNIAMSLRKSKLSKDEINKRVNHVANTVNIEKLIDKHPAQLSGGERQRVAIAKAIVRNPSVFLMDEPLANLDAALRELLRAEISVLQKRIETTMVLVTHDQVEAMTMGDRIAVMSDGELQQLGTPDEVYKHPANTFVATFIGSPPMHLFTGEIKKEDGNLVLIKDGLNVILPKKYTDTIERLKDKPKAILGVRPHDMKISTKFTPHSFIATVYAIEQMGKEDNVIITDEQGKKIKVITPPTITFQRDDKVYVSINSENIHLFNAETHQSL